MRGMYTIILLILSNSFMTLAWYGHLKFAEMKWFSKLGIVAIVLISWGIALFEYIFINRPLKNSNQTISI